MIADQQGTTVGSVSERRNGHEEAVFGRADHRVLNEADAGMPVKELCMKHRFSDAAFYGWRAKFRGMKVEDAKRLKALEQ